MPAAGSRLDPAAADVEDRPPMPGRLSGLGRRSYQPAAAQGRPLSAKPMGGVKGTADPPNPTFA